MKKIWFKRRRYGYGWIPASKEGWYIFFGYLALLFAGSYWLLKDVPDDTYQAEVGYFFVYMIVLTAALIKITMSHGPSPKWRWGKKDTDNKDEDF